MATMRIQLLSEKEIQAVHDASLVILRDTGIMVHHDEVAESIRRRSIHR